MQKFTREVPPVIIEAVQWKFGTPVPGVVQEYDKQIDEDKPAYGVVDYEGTSFTVNEGDWIIRYLDQQGNVTCMGRSTNEAWEQHGYVPYGDPDRVVKTLVFGFTLKGQDFNTQIRPVVESIATKHVNADTLLSGFMPRATVAKKGFDTAVCDCFDSLFNNQLNIYDETTGPNRQYLARLARELRAKIYIIGDVIDGVKEEAELYSAYGLIVEYLPAAEVRTREEKVALGQLMGAEKFDTSVGEEMGEHAFDGKEHTRYSHDEMSQWQSPNVVLTDAQKEQLEKVKDGVLNSTNDEQAPYTLQTSPADTRLSTAPELQDAAVVKEAAGEVELSQHDVLHDAAGEHIRPEFLKEEEKQE